MNASEGDLLLRTLKNEQVFDEFGQHPHVRDQLKEMGIPGWDGRHPQRNEDLRILFRHARSVQSAQSAASARNTVRGGEMSRT